MITQSRTIISGLGTYPATVGDTISGASLDLLSMTGSGFERQYVDVATPGQCPTTVRIPGILGTPKIAGSRFLPSGQLRIAIAEFGEFQSSSMLVIDVNIVTDKVSIIGVYNYDDSVGPRNLHSVHILANGDVIVAGEIEYIPFLMKWDGGFEPPVLFEGPPVCGSTSALFSFSLPILHSQFPDQNVPASYSILQSDGAGLHAVVTGIKSGSDILKDTDGYPKFGIATFDPGTFLLLGIDSSPDSMDFPEHLDRNHGRAGFVGDGIVQIAAQRLLPDCGTVPYVFDGLLREVDGSFSIVNEMSYGTMFGHQYGNCYADALQAASLCPLTGITDVFVVPESIGAGAFRLSTTAEKFEERRTLTCAEQSNVLYQIVETSTNLALTTYSF